jgi:hypothetical protein
MPRKPKHPIAALAKRGAEARWAKVRAARKPLAPFPSTILDLMDVLGLTAPSWDAWRVFLRAVFGLGLDAAQRDRYTRHTHRETVPRDPVRWCYCIAGRRSGKTYIAALIGVIGG